MRRARESSDGDCVLAPAIRLDNSRFAGAINNLAMRFSELNVGSGDVVSVLLGNRVEIVLTLFATWYRGAALSPMNPVLTDDEARYQLRDSNATVIVGDARAAALATELEIDYIDVEEILSERHADLVPEAVPIAQEDDHALIIYTAGTTGGPKGCVLDHRNVEAMVTAIVNHCELSPSDRSLVVLPLFHVNGLLISALSALHAGGSIYISPRFNAATFWDLIADYRPTYFSAVPTMFARLEADPSQDVDASSVRFAICGAAPMAPELLHSFEGRFGFRVVEGYGLVETTVAVTINPIRGRRKPGTAGPPLPGQVVSIVNPLGDPLPNGTVGEVVVYGPNVMRGYLGRPEDTAKVLRDRWLYTGDLGYIDPDGYLVLVDRIKDIIVRGGETIYPKEIEDVLLAHVDVLEASVIGRPDELYGEVAVAYVVPRPGRALDVGALRDFCLGQLAKYKVPREINVISGLPKNAVGNVLKPALRSSDLSSV